MKDARISEVGERFEYIFDDPLSGGKWKILSHEPLTNVEIQRGLRFMSARGHQRPEKGQTSLFKWPKREYRE